MTPFWSSVTRVVVGIAIAWFVVAFIITGLVLLGGQR